MTEKYLHYQQLLQTRDVALVNLAIMAVVTVLAWEILRTLPEPWRRRWQPVYLAGGLVLYGGTLIVLAAMRVEGLQ